MHKFKILGAAALLAGMIGSSAYATPLATAGASATGIIKQTTPDQGMAKAWYHGRHYGWYRGHHYGWRRHYWHRYTYWH